MSSDNTSPPPPRHGDAVVGSEAPAPIEIVEHRSLASQASAARIAIAFVMLADVASIPIAIVDFVLYRRVADGRAVSDSSWRLLDNAWMASAAAGALLFIISAIAVIVWFHRAYKNVSVLAGTAHKPGWAIGAWFVPILNLFRPREIMYELFKKSPAVARYEKSPLVDIWWALFVIGWFLGRIIGRMPVDTTGQAQTLSVLIALSALATLVEGGLLIKLIGMITTEQDDRLTPAPVSSET